MNKFDRGRHQLGLGLGLGVDRDARIWGGLVLLITPSGMNDNKLLNNFELVDNRCRQLLEGGTLFW